MQYQFIKFKDKLHFGTQRGIIFQRQISITEIEIVLRKVTFVKRHVTIGSGLDILECRIREWRNLQKSLTFKSIVFDIRFNISQPNIDKLCKRPHF